MTEIHKLLKNISAREPLTCEGLEMVPFHGPVSPAHYLLLEEAVNAGTAEVGEISHSGSVPNLRFLNHGELPVFLLDGEELTGAKQNRILNVTVLAGKGETILPVSCVEAGRWHHESAMFRVSDRVLFSELRSKKLRRVSARLAASGERFSDQGEVWDDIAAKSARMESRSPTGAAEAIYERHRVPLDKYVQALRPQQDQTGAAFFIRGAFAGLDLFDTHHALSHCLPKLVRSYALDDMDRGARGTSGEVQGVDDLVHALLDVRQNRHPGVGLGEDVRFANRRIEGAALVHRDRVVHLCAFPSEQVEHESGSAEEHGIAAPKRRRQLLRGSGRIG